MIHDGDRVMVCLSGGKDSLSLLHTLRQYQFYARARGIIFTLSAATVDPMSAAYDPQPLIPYLASLGVPYFFEQQGGGDLRSLTIPLLSCVLACLSSSPYLIASLCNDYPGVTW